MTLAEQLFADAFFSAIAAMGFAVISNPPRNAVAAAALLSAIGHSFRYYLMNVVTLDIVTSTFIAAFIIGLLSFGFARWLRCPSEVFTFPSLLPMIPGMYAYKMFVSAAKFARTSDSSAYSQMIEDIFSKGLTAVFILTALVIGVSLPMMLFHKESYKVTRER